MTISSVNLSQVLRTKGMRAGALALSVAASLGLSGGAAAAISDPAELRGYNSCVKAASAESGGELSSADLSRIYYLAKQGNSHTYYVNAGSWQDGVRVSKRITCETSRSGREVYSMNTSNGRFARSSETNQAIVAKR